jgi:hypothetical protein
MSGPPLGRPPKEVSLADRKQARADEVIRNEVEGKFGESKRRYGLARVMTKLASTSTAQISVTFLMMNSEHALRRLWAWLYLYCDWLHNASSVSCRFFENIKTKPAHLQAAFAPAAQ